MHGNSCIGKFVSVLQINWVSQRERWHTLLSACDVRSSYSLLPSTHLSYATNTYSSPSPTLLPHHQISPTPESAVGEAIAEPPLDEPAHADHLHRQAVCAEPPADPPAGLAVAAHLEEEPLVGGLVAAEQGQVELDVEPDPGAELAWGVAELIVASLEEHQFFRRVIRGLDLDKVSDTASTGWAGSSSPQGKRTSVGGTCA